MKITVHVKTSKKQVLVKKISSAEYIIELTAPAHDNMANEQLVRTLADYYGVPKSRIYILTGKSYPKKIIEIQ